MLIKPFDFRFKVSNSQPCIAAHLQDTQTQRTEANLAKELQFPTHGNYFSIHFFTIFFINIFFIEEIKKQLNKTLSLFHIYKTIPNN